MGSLREHRALTNLHSYDIEAPREARYERLTLDGENERRWPSRNKPVNDSRRWQTFGAEQSDTEVLVSSRLSPLATWSVCCNAFPIRGQRTAFHGGSEILWMTSSVAGIETRAIGHQNRLNFVSVRLFQRVRRSISFESEQRNSDCFALVAMFSARVFWWRLLFPQWVSIAAMWMFRGHHEKVQHKTMFYAWIAAM